MFDFVGKTVDGKRMIFVDIVSHETIQWHDKTAISSIYTVLVYIIQEATFSQIVQTDKVLVGQKRKVED